MGTTILSRVRPRLVAVTLAAAAAALGAGDGFPTAQTRVNQDAQIIVDFTGRVQAYVDLHDKADDALPEVSNSSTPDQVDAHRRALQRAIALARANARQGDIFTQEIRAFFRRQIGRALSGPDAAALKRAILEENPGVIKLGVNAPYPAGVPVATMPPQILAVLPKLPKEVEFRFMGDRLMLLDIHAELVADYMDAALPR